MTETERTPGPGPVAALLAAQIAIGSAALLARTGLASGLSPLALAAWRLTVAGAIVVAAHMWRRPAPRLAPHDKRALIGAGLLLSVHFAAWFVSLQFITVARSTLLVTTAPLWAGLGTVITGGKLPKPFWIGVGLALAGGWLVTSGGARHSVVEESAGSLVAVGDLAAILGAISIAGYLLLTESRQKRLGTKVVVAWTYPSAAAWTWLFVPVQPRGGVWPSGAAAWVSVMGMAALPQLVGHTTLNWCLRYFPAGVVSAATLLEPVVAGALAWVFLDEPLTTIQVGGAAVLLAGVGLSLWEPSRAGPRPGQEEPATE